MLNCFFSNKYADRGDLFEGIDIWKDSGYRQIQGTYPVLYLSFASVKADNVSDAKKQVKSRIVSLYQDFEYLLERYMGYEAVQYFRDMIEEIEDSYNGQIDELTVQNENLREKLEDIREVCRE